MSAPTLTAAIQEKADPGHVILSIYLRGGADGLHLVPPVADDAYHSARPGLRVDATSALKLDDTFSLHRDLAALHPLYQSGDLLFAHQCATEESSRSHFSAEDWMHHGGPMGGGWLGRFLHHCPSDGSGPLSAVSIGTAISDSLSGTQAMALSSLQDFTLPEQDPLLLPQLAELYNKSNLTPLRSAGQSTLTALQRISALRKEPGKPQNGAVYPDTTFAKNLELVAQLIRAGIGLRAATIELGGWDSHFTQLALLPPLMTSLANGLAAFHQDLGPAMLKTHVIITSEFGRQVDENVSAGTDHGRGGIMMLLGGAIAGGKVIADWPANGLAAHRNESPWDVPVLYHPQQFIVPVMQHIHAEAPITKIFPGSLLPPVPVCKT